MDIYKKVKINIDTKQQSENNKLISVHQEAIGKLHLTKENWTLTYKEPTDTGISGKMTTLSSHSNNGVSIDKSGTNQLSLFFAEGKQHISRMSTPDGNIDIGFLTRSLKVNIDEDGGTVKLMYVITGEFLKPINTTMNFSISSMDS